MQEPNIPQFDKPHTTPDVAEHARVGGPDRDREGWRSIVSTIVILLAAPLVALLLINFVFQSYEVDGPSMEPTLQNHDRLIVDKIPRTVARITGHSYIPHRGDVVIFNQHGLFSFTGQEEKQLIKRVIGLPGERVKVKDGNITIYNKKSPKGFNPDKNDTWGRIIKNTPGETDLTLGKNEVFVCGDNRSNSLDSRIFGAVPANNIVGKLSFRIFPIGNATTF